MAIVMNRCAVWLQVALFVLLSAGRTVAQEKVRLWYDQPASQWTDALPLGRTS